MQDGNKYVPPHLRNSGSAGGGRGDRRSSNSNRASFGGRDDNRRGSYNGEGGRGGYNGEGGRGGYNDRRSSGYSTGGDRGGGGNSRWNNIDNGGGGDRGGGGRSSYGGGGPRRSFASQVNERGFHANMKPDPRIEKRLFNQEDRQTTGINFDRYDDIPVEVSGEDIPDPIDVYTVDTIGEDLYRNTQLCGYAKPTPVQKYSVPIGTLGRDLMACAQTGSGKTAGFLFPIIMMMIRRGGSEPPADGRRRIFPEALIMAPTRELAQQIHDEAEKFTYCTGIASVVIYGGANVGDQIRMIDRGCDLLVATPGRLKDLIERGRLGMNNVHFLVLDEADRMLDMGFEPQIRLIVEQSDMPYGADRQTMMFSATFPPQIQRLASDFMMEYVYLTVGRVGSASKDVSQAVEFVEEHDKIDTLIRFLLTIEEGLILIFVETKRSCDFIEEVLRSRGFPACSIHGDKGQREREDALRAFKCADTPVMVATDVASRGLDIPNVTQVVNYDLPTNIDDYVHRIGRTGRAGNTGAALSFVNEKNSGVIRELRELLEENEQEVPQWLDQMCSFSGRGGGSRGGGGGRGRGRRGGGNNNFGSRDVRYSDNGGGGGGGGNRGGGGYGGGGFGGGGYGGGGYGGGYSGGGGGNFSGNSAW